MRYDKVKIMCRICILSCILGVYVVVVVIEFDGLVEELISEFVYFGVGFVYFVSGFMW